eukprot:gb/GECG01002958.1/.p1 GENE.gb/GECG01002958.1/~~gb/GECG01002958.1/.p1  ORF type:complete len:130 (+),score=14.50 gb/GECG01002958.1/:1-390(+)
MLYRQGRLWSSEAELDRGLQWHLPGMSWKKLSHTFELDIISNYSLQGRSYVDGHEVDGWKIKGLQDNYWYQTTSNGAPVQLVQEPDATRDFDVSSYSVGSLPDHIFDVPAGCDEKCSKKAPLSVCATLD